MFQVSREAALFPVKHLGQDIPHEVDLAALPGGAQPFLPDRSIDAGMGA